MDKGSIPNVYPICYSALLKLKWFWTHLLLASLISRESVDVEEAASTNAVLKFREKTLECQQACSWIALVPLYGLQSSRHKSFSCTKHGGSEPCEAAFWKYPYMTLTWLLHPSCHNLIINRDFLGGKLERLVIFWFMSKVFFRLPTQTMQYYTGNLAKWAENCIVWSHQKWVIYIMSPDNWLTSLRTPLHLWLCFENHVRQSGMQRQPTCFCDHKSQMLSPWGRGA